MARSRGFWSRNGKFIFELTGVGILGLSLLRKWHEHKLKVAEAEKAQRTVASRGYYGGS